MEQTINFRMSLPGSSDQFSVEHLNGNTEILDSELHTLYANMFGDGVCPTDTSTWASSEDEPNPILEITLKNYPDITMMQDGARFRAAFSADYNVGMQPYIRVNDGKAYPVTLCNAAAGLGTFRAGCSYEFCFTGESYDCLTMIEPVGTIKMYGGNTAPCGFLICDGSLISRTEYKALFSIIGTAYGEGDGSTTFALPDFKGKFAEGADSNLGTSRDAGLPDIQGGFSVFAYPGYGQSASGAFSQTQLGVGAVGASNSTCYNISFKASSSCSIYGKSTTVQPSSLCINYIIRY